MISVCMATYNGERFLKQQIDSILCQLDDNDELIISDDGSTDSTLDIIKSYKNTRIKLLKHNKDKSLAETRSSSSRFVADNFQNALIHAKGDYIFLSDQDDVWYFNKKQKMLESLKNNDLVMCNFSVIDADNDIICEKYFKKSPISKHFIINYLIGGRFIGCTMAFSKDVLSYCLPFPKAVILHDIWIGLLVFILGSYKYINEPLFQYRRHNSNVSFTTEKSKNSIFFRMSYRIILLMQIVKRLITYKLIRG